MGIVRSQVQVEVEGRRSIWAVILGMDRDRFRNMVSNRDSMVDSHSSRDSSGGSG